MGSVQTHCTNYVDKKTDNLDEALHMINIWTRAGRMNTSALLGNIADIFPKPFNLGVPHDIVAKQISAHDPVDGYLPQKLNRATWKSKHHCGPKAAKATTRTSMTTR